MKRRRNYVIYLRDMDAYAEKAQRFMAGLGYEEFIEYEEKVFAVIHALEIIGEAANHIPKSITNRYPEVPWVDIVSLRNFVIHGYDLVNLEVIWNTVHEDLPSLRQQIARILADLEGASEG